MFASFVSAVGAAVNVVGGWDADDLIAKLGANDPSTEVVHLACNRLGEDAFVRIARALTTNISCKIFDVQCTGVGDAFAEALGEAFACNTTLTEVYAFSTCIGNDGARHLAEGLSRNAKLEVLYLKNTLVGDDGAGAFAAVLPMHSTLHTLNLKQCQITDVGARVLSDAALRSCSLRFLKLDSGNLFTALMSGTSLGLVSFSEAALARTATRRLNTSNFYAAYANARRYTTEQELLHGIKRIVHEFGAETVSTGQQEQLIHELEQQIGSKACGDSRIAAGIAWTSAAKMDSKTGTSITFYEAVGGVLRDDIAGLVMEHTACYCRTLNAFLVQRRGVGAPATCQAGFRWAFKNDANLLVAFNAEDNGVLEAKYEQNMLEFQTRDLSFNTPGSLYTFKLQEPMSQLNHDSGKERTLRRIDPSLIHGAMPKSGMTARGSWLPRRHVEFFTRVFEKGLQYRYAGYLPSSESVAVANAFLEQFRPRRPEDIRERDIPVRFIFHFDVQEGCHHVNLLEAFTVFPDEREWLFQHYSGFRVRTPPNFDNYSAGSPVVPVVIEVDVIPNNQELPDNLPVARWH